MSRRHPPGRTSASRGHRPRTTRLYIEGTLDAGAAIEYDGAPVSGLERHVWVLEGTAEITLDGTVHTVRRGDCLRFRLRGPSHFPCPGPEQVRYALVIVLP